MLDASELRLEAGAPGVARFRLLWQKYSHFADFVKTGLSGINIQADLMTILEVPKPLI